MSATIILIDEHPPFREKITQVLRQCSEFTVVDEAGDAREGEMAALRHRPDIAVIDLSLPDVSGIHLTGLLLAQLPQMKIVIVSRHDKIDYVVAALNAGALGYVVKDSMTNTLRDCLEAAVRGDYYLDPRLSRQIAGRLLDGPLEADRADSPYGGLSPREREILKMLARGLTLKDIGEKLFISPKTVANHRANIMAKLDVHSTAQLVRLTTQQGLLGLIK